MSSSNLIRDLLRHPKPWVNAGGVALAILAALLGYEMFDDSASVADPSPPARTVSAPPAEPSPAASSSVTRTHGYDRLEGARLVDHRNNDGDSFVVRHGRREFELRLYFVDTAEKYLSDRYQDQRDRVADQASHFGLTPQEAVSLGLAAKRFTLGLLENRSFTVYTRWERVYDGERYYGFVELPDPDGGNPVYLDEILLRQGLARLHTKGEATPDGRTERTYEAYLEAVDKAARQAQRGAWGL